MLNFKTRSNMNSQNFRMFYKKIEFNAILFGLTFAHLITSIYWLKDKAWNNYNHGNNRIYCYPFFKNCYHLVYENLNFVAAVFAIYFIFSLLGLVLIFCKKNRISYYIFSFLFFLKISILFSRYNFMGNYHTMHLSLCVMALLSRSSYFYYKLTLALQYFFAGLLKLNLEWFSGAALLNYSPYMFKDAFSILSLAYVPVLEVILIWGLFINNAFIRRITLFQLILFHLYSYLVVGAFYPLIMVGLLFPVLYSEFFISAQNPRENYKAPWIWQALSFGFILVIITWNLSIKTSLLDPAKDGNIRYLSLNMLDAKLECSYSLLEERKDQDIIAVDIPILTKAIRTKCDPVVYETFLRRLCEKNSDKKFMFYLESKRTTEFKYSLIRNYTNVCKQI